MDTGGAFARTARNLLAFVTLTDECNSCANNSNSSNAAQDVDFRCETQVASESSTGAYNSKSGCEKSCEFHSYPIQVDDISNAQ